MSTCVLICATSVPLILHLDNSVYKKGSTPQSRCTLLLALGWFETVLQTWVLVMLSALNDGRAVWSVMLEARPAGGPYDINVTASGVLLTLKDVLFGDVWLCSGQSNMEFSIPRVNTHYVLKIKKKSIYMFVPNLFFVSQLS